jgi:hypothetical protein
MSAASYDEMHGVIVAMLDKLNQLEELYKPLMHKAEAQAAMAEIAAYRVTARGFFARIRAAQRDEGGGGTHDPVPPHGGPRAHTDTDSPNPRATENFEKMKADHLARGGSVETWEAILAEQKWIGPTQNFKKTGRGFPLDPDEFVQGSPCHPESPTGAADARNRPKRHADNNGYRERRG